MIPDYREAIVEIVFRLYGFDHEGHCPDRLQEEVRLGEELIDKRGHRVSGDLGQSRFDLLLVCELLCDHLDLRDHLQLIARLEGFLISQDPFDLPQSDEESLSALFQIRLEDKKLPTFVGLDGLIPLGVKRELRF